MIKVDEKPNVFTFDDGSKIWNHTFDTFSAKVYVPTTDLPEDIINYGYEAPYLLVFSTEDFNSLTDEKAKAYADETKLSLIAREHASSVVYIYPTCESGWSGANEELFKELISNSKIHEYHKDGYAILNNRFTKECDGYAIRGAIFRTCLFGRGESADYIAKYLIKDIEGDGLWGPADIAPTVCVLDSLSIMPVIERHDMPIVSIRNTVEVNEHIENSVDDCYIILTDVGDNSPATTNDTNDEKIANGSDDSNGGNTTKGTAKTDTCVTSSDIDYPVIYHEFIKDYMRWGWHGELNTSPDFETLGMVKEPVIFTLNTSADNCGDDKGTTEHRVGCLAYYNKDLFANGPAPLLLCFHGGGDSAMHIAEVSEWYRVANDHDFLLVCIENHLNSTATEMMELIEKLVGKYDIDRTRIYGTGFSMGGCKSWDLYQEYPQVFAGLAPMDATFDVGFNVFGNKVDKDINSDIMVPIFYAGGEITPLPELPFQAQKCLDRMAYVININKVKKTYDVKLDEKDNWENKIWGINGDKEEKFFDESRNSTLTLQYFESEDGNCYSVFGSISDQGHECRYHTCEHAWRFLSQFRRTSDGELVII